ncbi:MAG: diaminopimelate decarboxylase [Proteobacteria bacterium]|nr:diaminopimelate decarboxylase [Pseudomonadota bacterium]
MHHFAYRNGRLHAEGVDIETIVAAVGTPVYIYSSATFERHYTVFRDAMPAGSHVFYAMKANANLGVLATLARIGAGADTVSEGEIRKAMAAGIPADRIVFSGVGKTEAELSHAVSVGVYQINIESEGELEALSRVATRLGRTQNAVFRVNPDIGAGGHAKITTGSDANKFGISFSEAERLYAKGSNLPGIRIKGLALHIGSQILEFESMGEAFAKVRGLVERLRAEGHPVERLDLGGGVGVPYKMQPPFDYGPDVIHRYAAMIRSVLAGLDIELGFEPGRVIAANAGILVARALYVNKRTDRQFLVVDAAMNDLVRPAMYEAYHEIWPVREAGPDTPTATYDVVGPICETGDTFTTERRLPVIHPGDLIAFKSAGAYGATMASTYNQRLLVPEVLVRGDKFAVTRPRQSYDDLIGQDRLAAWQS